MHQSKISIRFIEDVKWADASVCDFSLDNHVDIWRICISSNLGLLNNFLPLLNPVELARAARYHHLRDNNRFVISRAGLRILLAKYLNAKAELFEFEISANKKPYLKNSSLFYNISHSGDWIILAISATEIGVDTEWVNPSFDFNDILKEYFNPDEIAFINETQSIERFFLLWTRKEALTKATGKGLDDDLKFIPGLVGNHYIKSELLSSLNNWIVSSFKVNDSYFASLANNDKAGTIRFWETDLSGKTF